MFIYESGQVARPRSRTHFRKHHLSSVRHVRLIVSFFLPGGREDLFPPLCVHARLSSDGRGTAAGLIQCLHGNNKSGDRMAYLLTVVSGRSIHQLLSQLSETPGSKEGIPTKLEVSVVQHISNYTFNTVQICSRLRF